MDRDMYDFKFSSDSELLNLVFLILRFENIWTWLTDNAQMTLLCAISFLLLKKFIYVSLLYLHFMEGGGYFIEPWGKLTHWPSRHRWLLFSLSLWNPCCHFDAVHFQQDRQRPGRPTPVTDNTPVSYYYVSKGKIEDKLMNRWSQFGVDSAKSLLIYTNSSVTK